MTSQLLVEMPAEGAARLLILSLVERLSQYAPATRNGDVTHGRFDTTAYRTAMRRLGACLGLYADALGAGVSRKARRRLRRLADAAERLHRADVQLAWTSRHVPTVEQRVAGEPLGDGPRAAAWLTERITRRRARALRELRRAQNDGRTLRRIAKRLSVYTTSVRLDTIPTRRSFADITADQLERSVKALAADLRSVATPTNQQEIRRTLRSAEHLGFLVEPLRAYVDLEEAGARLDALRSALERFSDTATVARVIIRGGRRLAADHASDVLRAAIWPRDDQPLGTDAANGRPPATAADLQRGFVVLAEALHDEVVRAFHELESAWTPPAIDQLSNALGAIAARLRGPLSS